ncbi:MAG: RNA 3'-terminal phosphate cyclase [Anaerolineae bacterium]
MIHIDGSAGEGGGQVLRTALSLSALTGRPVHLTAIRARRRNPGLAPQHLAGVQAAARLCGAEVRGAEIGSQSLHFVPQHAVQPGSYLFDISALSGRPSAGAVTLLLQTILLPLALASGPSDLILRGGTHVAWSPPYHYVEWVLMPALARAGAHGEVALDEWGWYPRGGGQMRVHIAGGARLTGVQMAERGDLLQVKGVAAVSSLPAHIPQRISGRANNLLREAGLPPSVQPLRAGGPSTGAGIFLALIYEGVAAGFSALGAKGVPSEEVANQAVGPLIAHHAAGHVMDRHLPDQLLPFLALAEGASELRTAAITDHLLTNASVVRQFIDREMRVEGRRDQPGIVRIGA